MSRCIVSLVSHAERFDNHQAHRTQTKRKLLETVREVNNSTVHPLNDNYLPATAPDGRVYLWALRNDLLTPSERRLLCTS